MAKTISTHNGSAANREHNIRNPRATDKQAHIDKSLKNQNEILHDEKPREAYRRIFGQALANYNARQTRPERQIRDYYAHIEKDAKKHTVYEMIVQVGDRNDTGIDAPLERECLREFYQGWAERNPHLECIGAYIHADETDGTVHMHIDYVPVATGYKRGMETQSALVKALEQQGFTKAGPRTAQIQWEARENAALETICMTHGIAVIHPEVEKRRHLNTEAYKAQQAASFAYENLENIQKEIDNLQDAYEQTEDLLAINLDQAHDAENQALEASQRLQEAQESLDSLVGKEKALKASVAVLEVQRADLEGQVHDAQAELQILDRAISKRQDDGAMQFGWGGLQDHIAAAKADAARENRLRSLEAFVQHPQIKPLWEQFQRLQQAQRGRRKSQDHER